MRSTIKECEDFIKENSYDSPSIAAVMNRYMNIYLEHGEIFDDFIVFSIKFRCYLLQNNIMINYVNKRDIKNFIKNISQYQLNTCIEILNLEDKY